MSNVTDYRFVLYERLASQKLNEILAQLNAHNHGSSGGAAIDIAGGAIAPGSITGLHIAHNSITGDHIVDGTITGIDIAAGTITINNLDLSSIHLSDGYAVYAP
jgi:hypothetical protein